jgi:peptidyl-prolyl cis-trans isomerase SurA
MKKSSLIIVFFLFNLSVFSQSSEKIVMKVGDENVSLSEFEFIFKKNNSTKSISKESLDEYMELFSVFKLKVKEAKSLKMDTAKSFINELNGYVKQLAVPYLKDKDAEARMVKETYDRLQKDIKVRHILIPVKECDPAKDTLTAFEKISSIRKDLLAKKINFADAANKYSTDSTSNKDGGLLGYFSALTLVYNFETEAYRLKLGELSNIVRTSYGYHLIQVDDIRQARGKIKVAHIFIRSDKSNKTQYENAKKRISDVYSKLKSGETFESLVKSYSEDYNSAPKGGELPVFGINYMVPEFEDAAFGLNTAGEYSQPVETKYGFHIIKLIEKVSSIPFETFKTELQKTLQKNKRWDFTKESMINKLKKEYSYKEYPTFMKKMETEAAKNNGNISRDWLLKSGEINYADEKLFEIKGRVYNTNDFVTFVSGKINSEKPISLCQLKRTFYKTYIDEKILAYKEENLPNEFNDFKMLVNEYRDGILLFNLMDQMVWGKSMKDTVGLKKFYEDNKKNYMWGERAVVLTVDCKDDKAEADARKLSVQLLSGKINKETFASKLNKKVKDNIILIDGLYSKDDKNSPVANMNWQAGAGETVKKDGKIRFPIIMEIKAPQPKTLKEAKGLVISDYQNYLEKQWIDELRKKYAISINKDVLYQLVSE